MAVSVIKLFLCLLESKNIILLTKAYNSEKCKGELPISSHSSTQDHPPSECLLYLHQLLQEPCPIHIDHPNETPKQQNSMCFKQTSRHTCITHKVMFSSIPRETDFKAFFLKKEKTNVFCLAFKLIFLELLLSCLSALTLASHAHKELGGINLFISYDTQKKKYILGSGDCHFHSKCLWWHLEVCITWNIRGCLTDKVQIPFKSTHLLLLYVLLSSNTFF